jgi:DNA invertase Pin-like site-specific DNA recombinase
MADQKLSPSAIHARVEIDESKPLKKRAVLYARVSTGDQHPETQLCDLRALAKQRGFEVIREYTDVISGAQAKRPGLDHLLSDAHRGQFDVLLVAAFDRVARSVRHFLEVLDELSHLGIEFVSLRENIDTGGPLGRAIVVIVGAIAELERSLIVERVRAGMRRAKLEGRRIGRQPLNINREQVVADRCSGMSLTQVSKKHRISRASVVRIAKEGKRPISSWSARSEMKDSRLIGTWKSDGRKTAKEIAARRDIPASGLRRNLTFLLV